MKRGVDMRKIFGYLISSFICTCLFFTSVHGATPVVSNVTGNLSSGQIITISGSNMVDEDKTNWGTFFTNTNAYGFEGASPASDGYGHATGSMFDPVYVTNQKLMGNHSVYFHTVGSASSILTSYLTTNTGLSSNLDVWIRLYAKWNYNISPQTIIKMFDTFGGTYQQYLQPAAGFQGMIATNHATWDPNNTTPTPASGNDVVYYYPSGGVQKDRWYEFEMHLKNDNAPYIFDVWMDGKQVITGTSIKTAGSFGSIMFGIINQFQNNSSAYMDHWMDGLVVSSTRVYPSSVIEVSNNVIYGQGIIKYQEPIYLSDGSVQFKADFSGLGSGPLYLWITNNRQQRSSYYLGSGLGTAVAIPSPPMNVR